MTPDEYTEVYRRNVLAALDFDMIASKLAVMAKGSDVALLCYEKPGDLCHRHLVAEWLRGHGMQCAEWEKPTRMLLLPGLG